MFVTSFQWVKSLLLGHDEIKDLLLSGYELSKAF